MGERLTAAQRSILRGVAEGRAVRGNERGPALTREQFGAAVGMAVRGARLVRIVPRAGGGPDLTLTDAGRAALAEHGDES
jgi:hypothetical protein